MHDTRKARETLLAMARLAACKKERRVHVGIRDEDIGICPRRRQAKREARAASWKASGSPFFVRIPWAAHERRRPWGVREAAARPLLYNGHLAERRGGRTFGTRVPAEKVEGAVWREPKRPNFCPEGDPIDATTPGRDRLVHKHTRTHTLPTHSALQVWRSVGRAFEKLA